MTPTIVAVEWLDAERSNEWQPVDDAKRGPIGGVVLSLGYLLRQDDDGIVLVQSLDSEGRTSDGRLAIPAAYVRSVRHLRFERVRKPKTEAVQG